MSYVLLGYGVIHSCIMQGTNETLYVLVLFNFTDDFNL